MLALTPQHPAPVCSPLEALDPLNPQNPTLPRRQALLLLRLDHDLSARQLLAELLAACNAPALDLTGDAAAAAAAAEAGAAFSFAAGAGGMGGSGRSTLLDVMHTAAQLVVRQPHVTDLDAEQRRMLQVRVPCAPTYRALGSGSASAADRGQRLVARCSLSVQRAAVRLGARGRW